MISRFVPLVICITLLASKTAVAQISLETPRVESILYLGEGEHQPLIVGLGGSEGGNAWSSNYWKKTRDYFIAKGYAFLALGYFGAKGTPPSLDKISIDDVHHAIRTAAKHHRIDKRRIAVIGGSRGADLVLLLGSYYKDIRCVVSIVGSNAVFPGHTLDYQSSCWTYKSKELPFLPVNDYAIRFLAKRDLRSAFEAMLADSAALQRAAIRVEKIKGPVLLLSATRDEVCPSTPMGNMITERLRSNKFRYPYQHQVIDGGHAAPLKHFDLIYAFFEKYFPVPGSE